jgi:hypothetical protein
MIDVIEHMSARQPARVLVLMLLKPIEAREKLMKNEAKTKEQRLRGHWVRK